MGPRLPSSDLFVFSVCPASFWVTAGWSLAKQIPTNILWSLSLSLSSPALILSRIPAPDPAQVKRGPVLWQNAVVLQSLTERKKSERPGIRRFKMRRCEIIFANLAFLCWVACDSRTAGVNRAGVDDSGVTRAANLSAASPHSAAGGFDGGQA